MDSVKKEIGKHIGTVVEMCSWEDCDETATHKEFIDPSDPKVWIGVCSEHAKTAENPVEPLKTDTTDKGSK